MTLYVIRNGHRFAYSEAELRREHPNVSFPKSLAGVDLSAYGVIVEDEETNPAERISFEHERITMPQFLWAIRQKGLRVQFESYAQARAGYERDYWLTTHVVVRSNSCVKAFAQNFALSRHDMAEIFAIGSGVEE